MGRRAAITMLGVLVMAGSMADAWGVKVTPEEMAGCRGWVAEHLGGREAPFSFVYGGRASAELLAAWPREDVTEELDRSRTRRTTRWHDPATGLEVRLVAVEYHDFATVEWTVYLRNNGPTATPLVEGLKALDCGFERGEQGEFLLHHNVGSPCCAEDYRPLETRLGPGEMKRIGAAGGRSTNSDLSYFNLELAPDQGWIIALGWPGQWVSEWTRDEGRGLRVTAGQELLRTVLLPGEEIRSPLVALQRWSGDWHRAQNLWRRWFIAHSVPRPGGKLPPTQWCGTSESGDFMMVNATEASQKRYVDAYLARGWQPDFWWMDAGWYPNGGDWTRTGTWEADPARFPAGLRPVTDYLHARGIRAILWFEPERVRAGTWLAENHPEWVLPGDGDGLLNLGDPAAWRWLVERVDGLITAYNLDFYRQDFNMDPLSHWRRHDTEDRQGMTEMRYVEGLLAYWDELLRRHPGLLYDNCASGGRRNDLESMRRGVPYTKSDYAADPVGVQGETYGISQWLPYFAATWGSSDDPYLCRSRLAQTIGVCLDLSVPDHLSQLPQRLSEWRQVVPHYWGDFWPLTPYSLEGTAWVAWQFDTPEEGRGIIQAFRREGCAQETLQVKLRGLAPEATYRVVDVDEGQVREVAGRALMEEGLEVRVPAAPGAAIVSYERR